MTDIRHTALAAVGALFISTICILGAVGPVRADTPTHQVQLQIHHVYQQPNAERSL